MLLSAATGSFVGDCITVFKMKMNRTSQPSADFSRREFIVTTSACLGGLLLPGSLRAAQAEIPTTNPVAHLKLAWPEQIHWNTVVDVTQMTGETIEEKLAFAQSLLVANGGGVAYFPPGLYQFRDSIHLLDGVVLRGAEPVGVPNAHAEGFAPPTRFEFPKFDFKAEGDGTPLDTAFKGIYVREAGTASNCGVVNIAINRGHIHFAQAPGAVCGQNRIVFGCVLRNAARPNRQVPDLSIGQHPWQRYTVGYMDAAIDVKVSANALVANNRLPRSGEDNFTMNGYVVRDNKKQQHVIDGVVFDYDNRAGIYVNHFGIGGAGGSGPDGTPETHPYGFRKGLVIRDNYVFNTGRCAIGFCGDGVECRNNVVRFPNNVWRPTATGRDLSHGASTNDNRAVEMRGWRWILDGNDYEVHRNLAYDRKFKINDGEGLMHEDHVNSTVKDSVLTNNRGNAYISIYQTAGIDGLLVEGNHINIEPTASSEPAIHIGANRVNEAFPCRNVRILNNVLGGTGIMINGSKEGSTGNVIRGNRTSGPAFSKGYVILNQANALVEDNEGFKVDETPWMSLDERRAQRNKK
jgi:hypothetical protein